MQELRLVAVSEDGTYAVLTAPGRSGRFSLPIDLASPADKKFVLYAQPPSFGQELEVLLVSGDQTVARKKVAFTVHDATQLIVGVVAVPAGSAQDVAQELIDSGVRIIFNYSEALLDVPHDVTVHTSNPAVDLLHALYFHLT